MISKLSKLDKVDKKELDSYLKRLFAKKNTDMIDRIMYKTNQIYHQMEQNKLENQEVKINANNYINKFTQSQMIISKQNAQINELGTKFINLESELLKNQMEFRLIKESENFKDAYIEHMEKEITTFNMKLKKLSKNHPALNFF